MCNERTTVNGDLKSMWEEAAMIFIKVLRRNFQGRREENKTNLTASQPAEFRTRHLQDTKQER
jgi:hypothetical protein